MENLVDMIEKILEKSNRIQQGFLDRLSNIESRIESIESDIENIYGRQIKISSLVEYQADLKDNILSQLDGIADRQKLMSGLVENIEDMLIDLK